ncbi:MAG: hypothetical protein H6711_13185 [Myxococcales bacterium]|nr:hypothetical protein [Myxococcales bacterium]
MTDAAPKSPRPAIPRWLLPALLAVAAVAYLVLREPPPPPADAAPPSFPPPSLEARAILGELAVGDSVGPFVVDGIEGPGVEGQEAAAILVHLSRPGVRMAISIAPRGAIEHPAPEQSARHDLYFGHVQPDGR